MTSPADELLDLARVDIGLSVALAQVPDSQAAAEIVSRQKDVQRRMRELQRQLTLADAQARAAPSVGGAEPRRQFAPLKGGGRRIPAPQRLPDWLKS